MDLLKHQLDGVEFLRGKEFGGLFFEQGLGKTITMLTALHEKGQLPGPVLVIAPLNVVPVWQAEVIKHGFPYKVQLLLGSKIQRLKSLAEKADIYVINYDGARSTWMLDALIKVGFSIIILDESHRIKNLKSQQTRACLDLAKNASCRYILTGTPITKTPEDIYAQMLFLQQQPALFGNWWSFRGRYVDYRTVNVRTGNGTRAVQVYYRAKHQDELSARIAEHCLRKSKDECLDLPEKVYKQIFCTMEAAQKKAYFEIKHTLATMLGGEQVQVKGAGAMVQKLAQVAQGFVYDVGANGERVTKWLGESNAKYSALRELLEDIPAIDNLVVFSFFQADFEMLKEKLADAGRRLFVYTGDAETVAEFQACTEPAMFLASLEQAKEGITLTNASHVIYYGNSYNYGTRAQSEDRCHRIGQQKTVIYYDLVCQGTIDERIVELLTVKKDLADKILGDSMRLAKLAAGDVIEDILF